MLTASEDCTVRIWSIATGECTQTFTGHGDPVFSAVFSRQGQVLTASADWSAMIWSIATGACTRTFSGHGSWVNSAVFNEDESAVLTASDDRTANIWSIATGDCTQTFVGHERSVNTVVCHGDGSLVLTASDDRTVKMWNSTTAECTRTFSGKTTMNSAVFSADGSLVLAGTEPPYIWNAETGHIVKCFLRETPDGVESAVFEPVAERPAVLVTCYDGDVRLLYCYHDSAIFVWNPFLEKSLRDLARAAGQEWHGRLVRSAVFSADGTQVLTASDDLTAKIWDIGTGECMRTFSGHLRAITSAVFAPPQGHNAV